MSARLAACFEALRAENRAGLIAFLMAGDPDPETSFAIMDEAIAAGADILEIGVPFTDPSADGPSVQRAGERALRQRAGLSTALAAASLLRAKHPATPLLLMGYANPAERLGPERFAAALAAAGADGALLVDLPPEEDGEMRAALAGRGLALIRFTTPTTDGPRLQLVLAGAAGFVYHVGVAGVTGAAAATPEAAAAALAALRRETALPVALGFGVRSPEQAGLYARFADAVVVGSALVDEAGSGEPEDAPARVAKRVRALAQAVQEARFNSNSEGAER